MLKIRTNKKWNIQISEELNIKCGKLKNRINRLRTRER